MKDLGAGKSLGRPGQASEVATSFVFLATPDSSFYCRFCLIEMALIQQRGSLITAHRWANFALLSARRLGLLNSSRYVVGAVGRQAYQLIRAQPLVSLRQFLSSLSYDLNHIF
jgi:hypothetical protein